MRPDDWMAVRFRTTVADEGFLEEDGQLWAPDGTLDRPLPPARPDPDLSASVFLYRV